MASLIGEFSLFYSIFPLQRPWVTSSWLARLSARLTTIDIRAMRDTVRKFRDSEVDNVDDSTGRRIAEALRERRSLPPFFWVRRIAAEQRTVKRFIRSNRAFFQVLRARYTRWAHIRTILPGFMMSFGSSACLMLRITATASPCSAIRKSILSYPMPCSPVHVP